MRHSEALEIVGDIQSQQWGLCTSSQAANRGIDAAWLRRLTTRGSLVRMRQGVYATPAVAISPELEVKSEWLAFRPELMAAERLATPALAREVVVSHTSAAHFWGVGDLWPDGVHFTVQERRRSRQPDVTLHKSVLKNSDWTIHEETGLPITTVGRTVADLAREGYEPSHLEGLISDAVLEDLVTQPELIVSLYGLEQSFGFEEGATREYMEWLGNFFPTFEGSPQARAYLDEQFGTLKDELTRSMRGHIDKELRELQQRLNRRLEQADPPIVEAVTEMPENRAGQLEGNATRGK